MNDNLLNQARTLGSFLGLAMHIRDLTEIKGALEVRDFEGIAKRMIELLNEHEKQLNDEVANA
jgi:hypothetical protein